MDINQRIKNYWEGEASVYSSGIEDELKGFQREEWKKLILENKPSYAEETSVLDILDIGTGPGFFPIVLTEAGHRVTGIDITENMIAYADKNLKKEGFCARLITMDSQELEFQDNTFDMAVCRNLTWTIDDPVKAYKEWYRVLKPGGKLLIFDACWYLHLFDEELRKKYEENERRIKEKYLRGVHQHRDPEEGDALGRSLFMSDKKRPQWDLQALVETGFSKVFSTIDVSERVWDEIGKELNGVTPQFMVGGEK
ncbi:class I SAM-dependent methyltransferase [Sinanaerobacter sp. ZZT-01]|uniref:class I SAM-dependent methyltransferase n=1 Tax=Sinanaerobacter sp. ZZT-01 TaxID=3111540 RepID=UPI002D79F0DC|nr:class I SAM-dependent methyltransferase [Sinanaerobacter sp. ZZT-01]WRR93022.1 class I SAM-dependent methyltransferase [Sinanaerobacter sp. ZZT-01]